ncbi:nucleotide-sugar transporter [Vairimorpha apis BRL 01]|uniref:Nucleotide-sugar transporter n=1 Tax=Vairimorpha apis BRL 01 TaxID=1037528 RepID=T0LBE8_9MICR|nr:nucleotide-sugar transporter [Vairimorpha apis BRL 01]
MLLNLILTISSPIPCTSDKDCFSKTRPDIHSLFCINNYCSKLSPPGEHCTLPTQCASYSYYGPIACSSKCKVENECTLSKMIESTYCCLAIPENRKCNPNRPSHLSGCDLKQQCIYKNDRYICGDSTNNQSWIFGAIFIYIGKCLINTGVNFQKYSYQKTNLTFFNYNYNTFYIGMLIYILGKILGYLSYIFGNQSLIAALSATGLVSNSILAPLINNEIFTYKDFFAILFVFCGTTYIIMNNKSSHRSYSLCELLKLYHKPYVETNSTFNEDDSRIFRNENIWFNDDCYIMKYFMYKIFIRNYTKNFIRRKSIYIFISYFFIFTLCICTFGQIYWLNKGLKRFDALLVVPLFHITWTLLSIITAGIYFQEFEKYDWEQFRSFLLGILIIFIGSLFLGSRIINKNRIYSREEKID